MGTMTRDTAWDGVTDADNSFALAIVVLRERVRRLPPEDQADLYQLLPALLGTDEDERSSASQAVKEILHQGSGKLQKMDLSEEPGNALDGRISFVSAKIRNVRISAGLTQEELAEKSGLPQPHLSKLESGKHSPTAKTLEKIAVALDVPVSVFDPSV